MRGIVFVWILGLTLVAGTEAQEGRTKPAETPAPAAVPAGAVRVDASTWRWTDARGTVWNLRQTPFGLSRYRDQDINRPTPPAPKPPTKVTDLGGAYRFERMTPFGPQIWEKKKADLNAEERSLVTPDPAPSASANPNAAQAK